MTARRDYSADLRPGDPVAVPRAYVRRCTATYHRRFDSGAPIRCEEPFGHVQRDGTPHFHSFAMRSWTDGAEIGGTDDE